MRTYLVYFVVQSSQVDGALCLSQAKRQCHSHGMQRCKTVIVVSGRIGPPRTEPPHVVRYGKRRQKRHGEQFLDTVTAAIKSDLVALPHSSRVAVSSCQCSRLCLAMCPLVFAASLRVFSCAFRISYPGRSRAFAVVGFHAWGTWVPDIGGYTAVSCIASSCTCVGSADHCRVR